MADDDWTPDFGNLDAAAPALGRQAPGAHRGARRLQRRRRRRPARDRRRPGAAQDDPGRVRQPRRHAGPPRGQAGACRSASGGDGVEVEFGELDSFHPDSLYRELPMFKALAELSKRLNNTATFAKAAAEVQAMAGGPTRRASRSGPRRSRSGAPAANAKLSDFARLVGIAPEVNVDAPVDALMKRIMAPFVHEGARPEARCAGRRPSTARSPTRCARCCIRASSRTSRRSGAAWT